MRHRGLAVPQSAALLLSCNRRLQKGHNDPFIGATAERPIYPGLAFGPTLHNLMIDQVRRCRRWGRNALLGPVSCPPTVPHERAALSNRPASRSHAAVKQQAAMPDAGCVRAVCRNISCPNRAQHRG